MDHEVDACRVQCRVGANQHAAFLDVNDLFSSARRHAEIKVQRNNNRSRLSKNGTTACRTAEEQRVVMSLPPRLPASIPTIGEMVGHF